MVNLRYLFNNSSVGSLYLLDDLKYNYRCVSGKNTHVLSREHNTFCLSLIFLLLVDYAPGWC